MNKLTNFFSNKKFLIGSEPPTQGKFEVGDLVVNTGSGAASTPMWICSKAGQPGEWAPVGAGNKYAAERSIKVFSTAIREVEIGIKYNDSLDTLLVFINDSYASKDVDYLLEGNKIKVVGNEAWNEMLTNDFTFEFVVFKNIAEAEEIPMISSDQIENGSITLDKLESTLANILTNIKPVDLSGYQLKNDNSLSTNNKTIVGAINELFQEVDSGKQLIADAIDDNTITKDSTFAAMSNTVNQIREAGIITDTTDYKEIINSETTRLSNLMINNRHTLTGNESLDDLIEILADSGLVIFKVKQIVCGSYQTFILKNDGTVWACGQNTSYQLGLNDTAAKRNTFVQVATNADNVRRIVVARNWTFIIKNDNSLWGCGSNGWGQLGLGYNSNTEVPTFTKIMDDVADAVCGEQFSYFLKTDGTLWSCGYNYYGQLGVNSTATGINELQQVTFFNPGEIAQIACGSKHSLVLKTDGTLWSCGYNNAGQLGLGTTDTNAHITFTQITTNTDNIKKIICGYDSNFIIKNDGSLWSCGNNGYGQLGLGTTTNTPSFTKVTTNVNNDVKDIAADSSNLFVIKNDGSLWACGYNYYGELGIGTTGSDTYQKTLVKSTTIDNVMEATAGVYHVLVMTNDGAIFSCGYNAQGQLGLGITASYDSCIGTFDEIDLS
jgi:alpha-tubulin suppressor-like RCC1 family protein